MGFTTVYKAFIDGRTSVLKSAAINENRPQFAHGIFKFVSLYTSACRCRSSRSFVTISNCSAQATSSSDFSILTGSGSKYLYRTGSTSVLKNKVRERERERAKFDRGSHRKFGDTIRACKITFGTQPNC